MAQRISFMKATGWLRVGLAVGTAALFTTPMLWAMGSFGVGEDAVHRAVIYALSGLWASVACFWVFGWALQGFVNRPKPQTDEDEDADADRPSRGAPPPPPSPPKSGGHKDGGGHRGGH